MGTFESHFLPGLAFTILGLWWMVNMLCRYYRCVLTKTKFTSSRSFSWCATKGGRCARVPCEGLFLLVASLGSCIVEISRMNNFGYFSMNSRMHQTMYFAFAFVGVVDIMVHYKVSLPPSVDYLALCIAFTVKYMLLLYHEQGRPVGKIMHKLLTHIVMATVVSTAAEIRYRNNIILGITRAVSTLLQGIWWFQMAFVLYRPGTPTFWDRPIEMITPTLVLYLVWQLIGTFVFMIAVSGLIKVVVGKRIGVKQKIGHAVDGFDD